MARVNGVQVARWAGSAGFRTPNLEVAVAVGLANGSDPAKPGGVWGVGGPAGDGAGQARAAFAQWQQQGWDEFPTYRSGAWRLWTPSAVVSIAAAGLGAVVQGADQAVDQAVDRGADAVTSAAALPFKPLIDIADYVGTDQFWNRATKVTIGLALLIIGSGALAWSMAGRPFFEGVGILDRKIAEQLPLAEGSTIRPRHVSNVA